MVVGDDGQSGRDEMRSAIIVFLQSGSGLGCVFAGR